MAVRFLVRLRLGDQQPVKLWIEDDQGRGYMVALSTDEAEWLADVLTKVAAAFLTATRQPGKPAEKAGGREHEREPER